MAKTELNKRKEYYKRILREDTAKSVKDSKYGQFLTTLNELVTKTDAIYENDGKLSEDEYRGILEKYENLAGQGKECLENKGSVSKSRRAILMELGKYIKKDLAALKSIENSDEKNLKDIIAEGRSIKVDVTQAKKGSMLGGQQSSRIAMKTSKGRKGFFTVKETTTLTEQWRNIINKYKDSFSKVNQENLDYFVENYQAKLQYGTAMRRDKRNYSVSKAAYLMGLTIGLLSETEIQKEHAKEYEALKNIIKEAEPLMTAQSMHELLNLEEGSRVDNKNIALYQVACALGCGNLIAKAEPMIVQDGEKKTKGIFMEKAEGSDFRRLRKNDPFLSMDYKEFESSSTVRQQFCNLNVIDFICGNTDRHLANIIYQFDENNKLKGMIGIDNDTSFPSVSTEYLSRRTIGFPTIRKMEGIDINTANMVQKMDKDVLKTILRDSKLTKKQIESACERLEMLQTAIEKGQVKIIRNWDEHVKNAEMSQCTKYYMESVEKRLKTLKKATADSAYEYSQEIDYAGAKDLSAETTLMFSRDTIKSMERQMKKIDTFYVGSKEFKNMREALYALSRASDDLVSESGGFHTNDQKHKDFANALKKLSNASKEYISKKALEPQTDHGNRRLEFAKKIQNRAWEISETMGFEMEQSQMEKGQTEIENLVM